MAIPKYADKRAHKFFHRGFVGSLQGEDGTNYAMHWSSMQDDLVPTSLLLSESHGGHTRPFCAFCGNRAFPIQNDAYVVTGHTCVCKGAMDEVEWIALHKAMKSRHEDELADLDDARPKTNPKVTAKIAKLALETNLKDIERDFFAGSAMQRLGLKVDRPARKNFDD